MAKKANAATVGAQGRVASDEEIRPPYAGQIHAGLWHLAVPIGDLIPDADNARFHPQENIDAIKASLTRFGQDQPLVVQKASKVVRKGNGRLQAARELGWTHLAAVFVDEDNIDAAARAIADNRSGELAKWDNRVLSAVIARIQAARPDFSPQGIGFTAEQVERLHAKMRPAPASSPGAGASPPPTGNEPAEVVGAGHVRVVQVYLTEDTYPLFVDLVARLRLKYGMSEDGDTLMEALRREAGYGEPSEAPEEAHDGPPTGDEAVEGADGP
jgi:hypothetical protein